VVHVPPAVHAVPWATHKDPEQQAVAAQVDFSQQGCPALPQATKVPATHTCPEADPVAPAGTHRVPSRHAPPTQPVRGHAGW
jgi:hypothetical protein